MPEEQLCLLCQGLNVDSLAYPEGYKHASSMADLSQSTNHCRMCELIHSSLSKSSQSEDIPVVDESVTCRFYRPADDGNVALQVVCGNRKAYVNVRIVQSQDDGTGMIDAQDYEAGLFNAKKIRLVANKADSHHLAVTYDTDTIKEADLTFVLSRTLMAECVKNHKCADPFRQVSVVEDGRQSGHELALDRLPARLIALDAFGQGETLDAFLVDIPSLGSKPGGEQGFYAALSYCWGPQPETMYKTVETNLENHKNRIEWNHLPRTFQDAFRITRRLEIPYLWIDAICIIQDSETDWETESAKMGAIYATACVTIAADVSSSVHGGILGVDSEERQSEPGGVRITSIHGGGEQHTIEFYVQSTPPLGMIWTPEVILDSPLSNRAWCMLERVLSCRTLHFTRQGVIWECRKKYFSFKHGSTFNQRHSANTVSSIPFILTDGQPGLSWGAKLSRDLVGNQDLTDKQLNILNAMFGWTDPSSSSWNYSLNQSELVMGNQLELVTWWNKNIVVPFSQRGITFFRDRLPAISGIAQLFEHKIRSPYVAGIWLAELDQSLEWRRAGKTFQDKKLDYPSFSWASHPGPVTWPYMMTVRTGEKLFSVEDYNVNRTGPDPFGRIVSATLTLRGFVIPAALGEAEQDDLMKRQLLDTTGVRVGAAELDLEVESHSCAYGFALYETAFGFLRLLLLTEARIGSVNVWRRIGIAFIAPSSTKWFAEEANEALVKLV